MSAGKLNDKVHEAIVESVRHGSYITVAAQSAGINVTTFRNWLERGEMEEARIAEGFDADPNEAKYLAFKRDVDSARSQAEIESVKAVRMASRNGTWQAAAWYLERSFPQRWGRNRIEEIIEDTAKECAAEHLAEGWDVFEGGYDLGVYSGDVDALCEALDRAPTRQERRDFERAVVKTLG
jgi:hypothetical protein